MSQHHPPGPEDPAFDALRAADPIDFMSADTDDAMVRDHIRSRLATQAPPRRRAPWLAVAASVAAAVVIGGTGYVIGHTTNARTVAGEPTGTVATAPERPAGAPQQGREDVAGMNAPVASEAMAADGGASTDKLSSMANGRTLFTQQGLSTEAPADGEVSSLVPTAGDAAKVAAVAAALGVEGEPVQDDWGWSVGSHEGNGPMVSIDLMGNLSYYNPVAYSDCGWISYGEDGRVIEETASTEFPETAEATASAVEATEAPDEVAPDEGAADGPAVDPMPIEPCVTSDGDDAATPFDQAAAEATFNALLAAAGLDPAGYTIRWEQSDGDFHWATADPGWYTQDGWGLGSFNMNFYGGELSDAYGQLGTLTSVGNYPLISPAEAVERLADPRFGPVYPSVYPEGIWDDFSEVPATPEPFTGGPIPWAVSEVTLTSAELITAPTYLENGTTLLVPTYRLSDVEGFSWDVIAVADGSLDFSS